MHYRFFIKNHALFPEMLMKMLKISNVKKVEKKNPVNFLLSRSTQKVNEVYSGKRLVLHSSFISLVEIMKTTTQHIISRFYRDEC